MCIIFCNESFSEDKRQFGKRKIVELTNVYQPSYFLLCSCYANGTCVLEKLIRTYANPKTVSQTIYTQKKCSGELGEMTQKVAVITV